MNYIKSKLSDDLAKKIIGNKDNALNYLLKLHKIKSISQLKFRIISRGKNKGKRVLDIDTKELWKIVVDNWNYEISEGIIRDIFKQSEKYKNGKEANNSMEILINEWKKLNLGNIEWPFSQGAFEKSAFGG